ncbi:MAG TPA: glycosyltransferase family 39 protein [Humisphaera sp.]|nr:glycosyltransferase family 39 protein [Humisphaera sp.]
MLLVLGSAVFVLFINGPDIVASHEARVAQPARQMAASGWPWAAKPADVAPVVLRQGNVRLAPDWSAEPIHVNPWLVPVLNGQIRLQKPPLPYWCEAVFFRLFHFSEFGARVVPALMGMLATFFLFDLARKLFCGTVAWCTALAWVSTYGIAEMYRKGMADPYLAFFTLVCVWAWVAEAMKNEKLKMKNASGTEQPIATRRPPFFIFHFLLFIFYVSFAFALLAKGPPALVSIIIPLAAYHLCFRSPFPASFKAHLVGLLVMLIIAAPWPLYVWKNVPHVLELWRYESVGELIDNDENARAWWFYLPQLFYLSMPWTIMWVVACIAAFTDGSATETRTDGQAQSSHSASTREGAPDLRRFFPMIWWLAIVAFFSFVHLKKNQYLLPAIAAESLMVGQALFALLGWLRELDFRGRAGAMAIAQAVIGVIFAAMSGWLILRVGASPPAKIAIVIAIILALLPIAMILRRAPNGWLITQAIAYTCSIVVFMHFYLAPLDDARSARPVAAEMIRLCHDPDYTILPYRVPEEASVYLPINLRYGFGHKVLAIVDDAHNIQKRATAKTTAIPEPSLDVFQGWVPDARVIAVRRVPVAAVAPDYRWKLYELTVERRGYALE